MSSKRFLSVCALLILITSSPSLQSKAQIPAANGTEQHRTMLSTYCFTCHNSRVKIGGLALDSLNLQTPEENAQIWEKALRTPIANVHLTLLQKVGVERDKFGDSTGGIPGV